MNEVNMWRIEQEQFDAGIPFVCGVDEAGRGPLAGPVCAAAVIFPRDLNLDETIPGLNDSKKLTDKKRRELFGIIQANALSYGIGYASREEIDEVNILQATFLAMKRAVGQLCIQPGIVLVDGNRDPGFEDIPTKLVVKGDSLSASIAAASILAKVSRDDVMIQLAAQYPQYGFDIHKGYGTQKHYAALEEFGPTPVHRLSFLKKFYEHK